MTMMMARMMLATRMTMMARMRMMLARMMMVDDYGEDDVEGDGSEYDVDQDLQHKKAMRNVNLVEQTLTYDIFPPWHWRGFK